MRTIRRLFGREDGDIIVAAAIIMAVLVMMAAVGIQAGSWFHNRRDIQKRADAGALAGAQLFNECFDPAFTAAQAQTNIQEWAKRYSGFSSTVGAPINRQIGTGTSSFVFQSQTYPGGGGPGTDDTYQTNTNVCDSGNIASPYGGLDLKLKQDSIGGLFKFSPLAAVYAHARVQLKEVKSIVPSFPLAVPEVVPGAVGVTFINEDTNAELTGCSGTALVTGTTCTFALANSSLPGTDPYNLGPWVALGQTVKLPAFASGDTSVVKHIGMRVGVGDTARSCVGAGNGTTWQCYNADGGNLNHGVVMIAETNPTQTGPKLIGVWPSTCSTYPFAGDSSLPTPCPITLRADIDFGSMNLANATVTATVTQDNVPNSTPAQTIQLTHGTGNQWTGTGGTVNVLPATGGSEYSIDISWKVTGSGGGQGDFGVVQRVVGATTSDDGPLDAVSLTDGGAPVGPYSYVGASTATSHTMDIRVLLQAPFNKLTVLREAHSGSATAFILCRWKNGQVGVLDNGQNALSDSMTSGCQVPYQVNSTISCNPDPLSAPDVTNNPDCTQNKPCDTCGNTITQALFTRFGCARGATAHRNLWPDYSEPGDPRAVTLVTTSFGAFQANGSNTYPVTGFGAFYIAGVTGRGADDPINGNICGDSWPSALGPYPGDNTGTIWGYFIKYANNDGTPSGRACQVNSLNNCVAVLTR